MASDSLCHHGMLPVGGVANMLELLSNEKFPEVTV